MEKKVIEAVCFYKDMFAKQRSKQMSSLWDQYNKRRGKDVFGM